VRSYCLDGLTTDTRTVPLAKCPLVNRPKRRLIKALYQNLAYFVNNFEFVV